MWEMSVAEQRHEAVLVVISDGRTITEVAAPCGVAADGARLPSASVTHLWHMRIEQDRPSRVVDEHAGADIAHWMDVQATKSERAARIASERLMWCGRGVVEGIQFLDSQPNRT
jgi:hypothetical protein